MKILIKTLGWLIVSGLIIFSSNVAGGAEWKIALIGALYAKIGTTIAYFFYEFSFEKFYINRIAK